MRRRTSRRLMAAVLLAVLVALLLPPLINVNRYRRRVAEAIGRGLGREVTVSNIELKLLPRPGVVLSNFVVAEDPDYGAEPMLRADTVTAYIRLTSLWRGRLEIGTLDLDNPSLNLVRRADGHWNLEELVGRASQVSSAPTAKSRPEARPRFPYVEASTGRINFKLGDVKKAFAFTDADFALWLESENQWGIRVEARPVRTDVNITDTGTLKLDGRFQRAASLRDTPVYLKLNYSEGPLGQLSKLFYGRDRGWRGSVRGNAVLTGSPSALGVTADAEVNDFRRYDISLGAALRLRAHCTGMYSSSGDTLYDVRCESPVGPGVIRVKGDAQDWGAGGYDVGISGDHIPAEKVVAFVRHAKKDLPLDLTAAGEVEGAFTVHKTVGGEPQWSGGGRTTALALQADVLKDPLELGEVEFVIPTAKPAVDSKARHSRRQAPAPVVNPGFQLAVKPFAMPLGADSPATASGLFDEDHYGLHLSGGAELGRLLNAAQALGVGTPGIGLAGPAQLDIQVAGSWMGFAQPSPTGKVQAHNAIAELQGVSEPLLVDTATVVLEDQLAKITAFSATFKQGTELSGSASFPVHCTGPETCVLDFDVRADDASLARLNQLVNPSFSRQPWYRLLAIGKQHNDALLKLRAHGRFSAPHFAFGPVTASNVNGTLELSSGKLRIQELRADLLGGHEDGSWLADFTFSPPRFMGNGVLNKVSMAQLASLMHDNWATGTADGEYSVSLSGLTADKLRSSASGTADFNWTGGAWRHIVLEGRGAPLTFSSFTGKIAFQDGMLVMTDSKLKAGGALYSVKGTASYDRALNVKLERAGGKSYAISGTLEEPKVESTSTPSAEASLR